MDTVLPTDEKGITALPGQHSGVMSERVLLPAFEQAFVDTLAIGASGGLGADCWHQFARNGLAYPPREPRLLV